MTEVNLETVNCPLCGPSQTTIWLDDGKPTKYIRCAACGTVFASPRLARAVRHARTASAWSYSPRLLAFESKRRLGLQQDAEFIQKYVGSGKLLDVGCSSGDFFDFFPESRWERYGVELSSTAADYAARAHAAQVMPGTLRSANWPGEFFDLVSMIDMFYYVDDPEGELIEVRRILKPNGMVAIEITGQAYMFFRSRGIIALLMEGRWSRLSSDSHLFWFNPVGLQQLLKTSGFTPIAWHVVPGPTRANPIPNFFSSVYYRVFSATAGRSMMMLNWAPKYICLAQRG
jgi:SAM-dependent methyltransferase